MAKRWTIPLIVGAGLLLLLALPMVADLLGRGYWVGIGTHILIFALVAGSLNFILGYGGMISFGHAAFFGTGAYVVGIMSHHATMSIPFMTWPFEINGTESALVAWPLAMAVAAVLAFFIGLVSLRTHGLYFIMITLAFAQMVFYFFVSLDEYGGEDGLSMWARSQLPLIDLNDDVHFYYLVLAIVVAAYAVKHRVVHSRFGVVLRGSRDNDRRMRALGYSTRRHRLSAFTLAGAVAGLAGALMANQSEFVSPALLHWPRSGEMLIMVILGGIGTLFGPFLGAAAFLLLEEVLVGWTEHWMIVLGPILLLVVLFAKGGLWSLVDRAKGASRE